MGNKQPKQSSKHRVSSDPYPKAPTAPVMMSGGHAPPSYAEATVPMYNSAGYPHLDNKPGIVEPQIHAVNYQQQTYQMPSHNYGNQHYPGHGYQPNYSHGGYSQAAPLPQGPNPGAPTTYVIPKAFDAGARFDGIAKPHIPPPPPGCAPNAAQLAVAQGHNVVLGQKKSSVIKGGSNGGYTFW